MPQSTVQLERRLRVRYAVFMISSNVIGALVVAFLVRFALPLPQVDDPHHVQVVNAITLVAYLAFAVPVGTLWVLHLIAPARRWLQAERPPTEAEQRTVLLIPAREAGVHATLWTLGGAIFVAIDLQYGLRLGVIVAITAALGATTTGAVGYLLATAVLRPAARLALAHSVPEQPVLPGITMRVVLTWALGCGVPVFGAILVAGSQLTGIVHASADRVAWSVVALCAIGLSVGLLVMALTARAIAAPVEGVRRALARVERGETDVEVRVEDGSELGLLQAGMNRMVEGLRERERLRDLFGRQVGEDVARQALERGVRMGGEEREVAVLFVDVVGSTELAHERPAAEVVDLLNGLFAVVVEVTREEGGLVNKFIGDAALCVFGAPLDHDDPAGGALRAARELCRRVREELDGCQVGIGVAAGTVVAGNLGVEERFEYTVIGDPVNEAARLTELAKEHDRGVLASEAAVSAAGEEERARWNVGGQETLRGRAAPTRLAYPG